MDEGLGNTFHKGGYINNSDNYPNSLMFIKY